MNELSPLQRSILDAHRRGDDAELCRLQALFRSSAVLESRSRSGATPILLAEPRAPRAPVQRSRARWYLGSKPTAAAPAERVELRESATSPLAVTITDEARDGIAAEIDQVWGLLLEEVEAAAGLLIGRIAGDSITVTAVTGPGRGARGGIGRMSFDQDAALAEARGRGTLLGAWHAHASGASYPSAEDLADWGAALARGGLGVEVGLLVTSLDGWVTSELHPWVVRHENGRAVCEPAALHRST